MSEPTTNMNGKAASNGHAATNGQAKPEVTSHKTSSRRAAQQDLTALIEQAEKFRNAAHDLTHQAGDLVKSLKQHRRQSRAIESTLASLRQLKALGV